MSLWLTCTHIPRCLEVCVNKYSSELKLETSQERSRHQVFMLHSNPFPVVSFLRGEELHTELLKPQRRWGGGGDGGRRSCWPWRIFSDVLSEMHVISKAEGWKDPVMS